MPALLAQSFGSTAAYMGVLDGRTPYGTIIGMGPVSDFPNGPPQVVADPNRRSLTRQEWMNEFFTTTSTPVGHGFSQANINNDFASYSFEPNANIPLKVIVLDDTQENEGFDPAGQGYLDNARFTWLVGELDKGQAEGKLMIIASHIPIEMIGYSTNNSNYSPISNTTLLTKLSAYPNLILWLAGHGLFGSAIRLLGGRDLLHPGFPAGVQILRYLPQQRQYDFDIYYRCGPGRQGRVAGGYLADLCGRGPADPEQSDLAAADRGI
jgi:hypothetical protein